MFGCKNEKKILFLLLIQSISNADICSTVSQTYRLRLGFPKISLDIFI